MRRLLQSIVISTSLLPVLASAAQLRIFVAGAAKASVEALLPGFERAGGDIVLVSYDTAGALRDRVLKGEKPDLAILTDVAVDVLSARGLVKDGDRREVGAVVAGLAVRQGTPLPDITTADALRRTLLAVATIGYPDALHGATSGAQFEKAVDALGIHAQIASKTTALATGVDVVNGVVAGKFDIGVSQSSEILPVAGVRFVGGLPPPFELHSPYAMVALGGSEPGRRLMRYLDTVAAHAQFQAGGFSAP
jgi:molybdate transport system substrate-binding protein